MFERLQKPFLTVKTGEAYQPIRITYDILQPDQLTPALEALKCLESKPPAGQSWFIYWRDECEALDFASIESFKHDPQNPERLGTVIVKDKTLILNLPSFKRACLLAKLFHHAIDHSILIIRKADFLNKVFGLNERIAHGFTELLNEQDLEKLVSQRVHDYEAMQERCEQAATAEEALAILSEYTKAEASKKLPYAERYFFDNAESMDPEVAFLGFYIFLRSRELVAIRRWMGDAGYNIADANHETVEQVFGSLDTDTIS